MDNRDFVPRATFPQFDLQRHLERVPPEFHTQGAKRGPFGLLFLGRTIFESFNQCLTFYDYCFTEAFPKGNLKLKRLYLIGTRERTLAHQEEYLKIEKEIKQTVSSDEEVKKIVRETKLCEERLQWHIEQSEEWKKQEKWQLVQGKIGEREKGEWEQRAQLWQSKIGKFAHYPSAALMQAGLLLDRFESYLKNAKQELAFYQTSVKIMLYIDARFKQGILDYIESTSQLIVEERRRLGYAMWDRLKHSSQKGDLSDDDVLFSLVSKVSNSVQPHLQFKGLTSQTFDFFFQFMAKHLWDDFKNHFPSLTWFKGDANQCQIVPLNNGKQIVLVPLTLAQQPNIVDRIAKMTYRGPSPYEAASWNLFYARFERACSRLSLAGFNEQDELVLAFCGASFNTVEHFKEMNQRLDISFFSEWQEMLKNLVKQMIPRACTVADRVISDLQRGEKSQLISTTGSKMIKELASWTLKLKELQTYFLQSQSLIDKMNEIQKLLNNALYYRIMHLEEISEMGESPLTGLPLLLFDKQELAFIAEALEGFPTSAANQAALVMIELLISNNRIKSLPEIELAMKNVPSQYDQNTFLRKLLGAVLNVRESFHQSLLELVESYDKAYPAHNLPTLKENGLNFRSEKLDLAMRILCDFLDNPKEGDIQKPLQAIVTCSIFQPHLMTHLKERLGSSLKKYDGSHPLYNSVVVRLQDPELTFEYCEKRFLFLFPTYLPLFVKDKELQEMIFCHPRLIKHLFDRVYHYFVSNALQLGQGILSLDSLKTIFSAEDIETIASEVDHIYFEHLKKCVEQRKESDFIPFTMANYPPFPVTSSYRQKVNDYFLATIQTRWSISIHRIIIGYCSESTLQASCFRWLEMALADDNSVHSYRDVHELYIGTGFTELSQFYGLKHLDAVFDLTLNFLKKPKNSPLIYAMFQHYFIKQNLSDDLPAAIQPLFQRYDYLCDRVNELSKTNQVVEQFHAFLDGNLFKQAFDCYSTLLAKKMTSSGEIWLLMTISRLENDALEWMREQFEALAGSDRPRGALNRFKEEFVDKMPNDNKEGFEALLKKESSITSLHLALQKSIQAAFYQSGQWLLALKAEVIDNILIGFSNPQKRNLCLVVGALPPQDMDTLTKEATIAFVNLLQGTSKNSQKDKALLLLTIKWVHYRQDFFKLTEVSERHQFLTKIASQESALDAKWICQHLESSQLLSHPALEIPGRMMSFERSLLALLLGAGELDSHQCIRSVRYGNRRLNPDYQRLLFNEQGQLIPEKGENRHPVPCLKVGHEGVYLKFFSSSAGIQLTVNVCERHFFQGLLPHYELLRFPGHTAGQRLPYGVLASQEIPGKTLSQLWKEKSPVKILPRSYSERALSAMLFLEQNGGPENQQVTPQGEIVNIANGQALGKAFRTIATFLNTRIQLQHIASIYCFNEMNQAVDSEVVKRFAQMDIYAELKSIILELQFLNEQLLILFPPHECQRLFKDQHGHPTVIPIPLSAELIIDLWSRLRRMQQMFREHPHCSHMELLEALHPDVARLYKKAIREYATPYERFSAIKAAEGMDAPIPSDLVQAEGIHAAQALEKLEELKIEIEQQEKVRKEVLVGQFESFAQLPSPQAKEAVINGDEEGIGEKIVLGSLPESQQLAILKEMSRTPWTKLHLSQCKSLDDNLLKELLERSKNQLLILDISGCKKLSAKVLEYIQTFCTHLQFLNISHLPIQMVSFKLQKLKRLVAHECQKLTHIVLKCRELRSVAIPNSPVSKVEILSRNPTIVVQGAPKLQLHRGLIEGKHSAWTLLCSDENPKRRITLHDYAENGTLESLNRFKRKRINFNTPDMQGLAPIHRVLTSKRQDKAAVFEFLLLQGADPNCTVTVLNENYKGQSALHLAIDLEVVDPELWQVFKKSRVNFNQLDRQNLSPLLRACEKEKETVLTRLLEMPGMDVTIPSPKGVTALHMAAGKNRKMIAIRLLELGANVSALTSEGRTPFDSACTIGNNFEIANLLLQRGAKINHQHVDGGTVLHDAVRWMNVSTVEYLLLNGIDLNIQAADGSTALHLACSHDKYLKITEKLLKANAKLDLRDSQGFFPLEVATIKGCTDTLELLTRHFGSK